MLKGALLLRLWSDRPYRATRDLDLLRAGEVSEDAIRADVETICSTRAEPDAVSFDARSIEIEAIRAEDEYSGSRVTLPARCGTARLKLQIDMGIGDSVWPPSQECAYPALLDFPPPKILAYPPEAVIAEKLEAIVVLGDRNSRIKDFFDLNYLARRFDFDRTVLADAVRQTFARRHTPIPTEDPFGLTSEYWANPLRPVQVQAFAQRAGLVVGATPGEDIVGTLRSFLLPILEDLRRETPANGRWIAGGPWQ